MNKFEKTKILELVNSFSDSVSRMENELIKSKKILKNFQSILNDIEQEDKIISLSKSYMNFTSVYYKEGDLELFDDNRKKEYVFIRKCFYETCLKRFATNYNELGKMFGFDRGTVSHAVKDERNNDETTKMIKEQLINRKLYDL